MFRPHTEKENNKCQKMSFLFCKQLLKFYMSIKKQIFQQKAKGKTVNMCTISQMPHMLQAARQRIKITLTSHWQGPDILIRITGGAGHIGAVALADAVNCQSQQMPGHREGPLACNTAKYLANALQCKVAVVCGIHYNDITTEEIEVVLHLVQKLAAQLAKTIISERAMLTMQQLDEFQRYLESPQAECDFKEGNEKERTDFLELLEKLMDVADQADKLATKLIFRGNMPGLPQKH